VCGGQDPLAPPAECRTILQGRPDARLEEVPAFGHYPMLEDPKRFGALVSDFLK
jgi:pimeloyl-ACP methyl ester carboxylesterase